MTTTIVEQNTVLVPIPAPSCKTTPEGKPPKVVMVNITTRRPNSDCTVVLTCGDHAFVKHESVIAFEHADLFDVAKLERGIRNGHLKKYPDIDNALFESIKQGLMTSSRTPESIRQYCNKQFGSLN